MTALRFGDLAALQAHLARMADEACEDAGLSELDHGLQCAAELRAMAPDDAELQVAGLLHDVAFGSSFAEIHHLVGADALGELFGARVAQLVALHVEAKRYLVTTDPAYRARLSPVSIQTLALQGGVMSPDEVAAFEAEDHWRDGLKLRVADEAAKVAGRSVPGLETWLPTLRALAARRG